MASPGERIDDDNMNRNILRRLGLSQRPAPVDGMSCHLHQEMSERQKADFLKENLPKDLQFFPWEIFFSPKALNDVVSLDTMEVKMALGHIATLGRGCFEASKKISFTPREVRLFVERFSKSGRIVFEKAVSHSLQRADIRECIRIWTVFDVGNASFKKDAQIYIQRQAEKIKQSRQIRWYRVESSEDKSLPRHYQVVSEAEAPSNESDIEESLIRYPAIISDGAEQWVHIGRSQYSECSEEARRDIENTSFDHADADDSRASALLCAPSSEQTCIINDSLHPPSILVMGRSGTGKTLLVLQSMWAKHRMHYKCDSENVRAGHCHHQVFVTCNHELTNKMRNDFRQLQRENRNSLHVAAPKGVDSRLDTLKTVCHDAFPLFLQREKFLFLLDSTLENPFFKKIDLKSPVISSEAQSFLQPGSDSENDTGSHRKYCTYETFKEKLWPAMIGYINWKGYSIATVYAEIISNIKSTVLGKQNHHRHLTEAEYINLPFKRVSHLSYSRRQSIYQLFMRYEHLLHEKGYFDIADVVNHIQSEISKKGYHGVPLDTITVDEVQDFTQAELYLFITVASDKNSLLFAGDTAQTIAEGNKFRFSDLRCLFMEGASTCYGDDHNEARPKLQRFNSHIPENELADRLLNVEKETRDVICRCDRAQRQLGQRAVNETHKLNVAKELHSISQKLDGLLQQIPAMDKTVTKQDWWLTCCDGVAQGIGALQQYRKKEINHQEKWLASNLDCVREAGEALLNVVTLMKKAICQKQGQTKGDQSSRIQMATLTALTKNYRSSHEILECANKVVESLRFFFPYSIDKLPRETANRHGIKPLLYTPQNMNVFYEQHTNKCGNLFFRADQVALVRSEAKKAELIKQYYQGVIQTIFEFKGGEQFEVFIYDFFEDQETRDIWAIVARYFEEKLFLGTSRESAFRFLGFDEFRDQDLCVELKYLYTAMTRAIKGLHFVEHGYYDENFYGVLERSGLVKYAQDSDFEKVLRKG